MFSLNDQVTMASVVAIIQPLLARLSFNNHVVVVIPSSTTVLGLVVVETTSPKMVVVVIEPAIEFVKHSLHVGRLQSPIVLRDVVKTSVGKSPERRVGRVVVTGL